MRKLAMTLLCSLALVGTGMTTAAYACPKGKCKGKNCKLKGHGKDCKDCKHCKEHEAKEGKEAAKPADGAAPAATN